MCRRWLPAVQVLEDPDEETDFDVSSSCGLHFSSDDSLAAGVACGLNSDLDASVVVFPAGSAKPALPSRPAMWHT